MLSPTLIASAPVIVTVAFESLAVAVIFNFVISVVISSNVYVVVPDANPSINVPSNLMSFNVASSFPSLTILIVYVFVELSSAVTLIVTVFSPTFNDSPPLISTSALASLAVAVTFTDVTSFPTFTVYDVVPDANPGLNVPSATDKPLNVASLFFDFLTFNLYVEVESFSAFTVILNTVVVSPLIVISSEYVIVAFESFATAVIISLLKLVTSLFIVTVYSVSDELNVESSTPFVILNDLSVESLDNFLTFILYSLVDLSCAVTVTFIVLSPTLIASAPVIVTVALSLSSAIASTVKLVVSSLISSNVYVVVSLSNPSTDVPLTFKLLK